MKNQRNFGGSCAPGSGRQLSDDLETEFESIGAGVLERLYRQLPSLEARYGPEGRHTFASEARRLTRVLAIAARASDPVLLCDYVAGARQRLSSQGVMPGDLAALIAALGDALEAHLPGDRLPMPRAILVVAADRLAFAARTAELQGAVRDLEVFASAVSHDLRSPARRMAGFAGLLREELGAAASGEVARHLGTIESQAKEMNEYIERLLELARYSHRALRLATLDAGALAREAWESFEPALRGRAELRLAALPAVSADRVLLKQVFVNLFANALKFSAGRERPLVEAGARAEGGRTEIFVRDNGAGFDMAHAARLFRPFSRLHSRNEFEGSGVGLAIVEMIVRRHGGRVRAESEPGRGATFSFSLR